MRVGVVGAAGRMGREVCSAVAGAPDMELVAAVDTGMPGEDVCGIRVSDDLGALVTAGVDAVVDFTRPDVVVDTIRWCVENGMHVVVGTSGFTEARIESVRSLVGAGPPNVVIAPNFAVGAVLMMHLSEIAAPHFDRVEVVELHHDGKVDAPSGTALRTAERLEAVRDASGGWPDRGDSEELVTGSRGGAVGAVRVHAIRLPGLVAHQEVLFGGQGETLTIRHDSLDRSSFMPGVLLALGQVAGREGLTVGLEPLLGLEKPD